MGEASCRVLATALQSRKDSSVVTGVSQCYAVEDSSSTGVRFVHADITCVDFSDADIVFANSVCYPNSVMESIALQAHRLRSGAYLVSVGGFKSPLLTEV